MLFQNYWTYCIFSGILSVFSISRSRATWRMDLFMYMFRIRCKVRIKSFQTSFTLMIAAVTCCLFLGPKYDSAQPSYPGFERDVFKTVSDYFYSLPQPLLTYELYELFINVLGRYWGLISWGYFLLLLTIKQQLNESDFKRLSSCWCCCVTGR